MNIALLGPTGSGKGTHLARIAEKFGLIPVCTGTMLRENLAGKTALGVLARKYMDNGELVPDEVVDAMVESCVADVGRRRGVVFDGFPRTVQQAFFLDGLFSATGKKLDLAVYLNVGPATIIRRIAGRMFCQLCHTPYHMDYRAPKQAGICDLCGGALRQRPDDNANFAAVRLRNFLRSSGPLLDHYKASGRLAIVDAESGQEQVYGAICQIVEKSSRGGAVAALSTLPTPSPALAPSVAVPTGLGFVLVGGPGSGKGTQAEQLCAQLHLPHIATGDLFRDNLKRQTELGQLAKSYMDRGELVPDEVTDAMVEERLARTDASGGFILDGFPRTLHQAHALKDMLAHLGRRLAGVIFINVSDAEIVKRLSGRLICRNCQTPYHTTFNPPAKPGICDKCGGPLYQRDDDNPKTVMARIKTFHTQTDPVIEYYIKTAHVAEVPGEGDVAGVSSRALAAARELAA